MKWKLKPILAALAFVTVLPINASAAIQHGSYLELEALKRLHLQVGNLIPKVKVAHETSNHAQLRTNYSQILTDIKAWETNLDAYIKASLTKFSDTPYESSYTTFKRAGKAPYKKTHGTSESERVQLERIRNLIVRMKPLIREAESTADNSAKLFFRYNVLWQDHNSWIKLFDSHLGQPYQPNDFDVADFANK
ncbi:hypothetical protein VAS14_00176 [Vibrio angustum S14]|uniref:DUF2202 domain-containing protein n=1 Tax=Photobacterium angustum (strain S14 / CCUG 15956) TaxID=314292 RepID=Q1ZJT4_PHOAS|nr:RAQPRD family integrative conjugative element protein [Photobacterium angustum]EAS62438.1 hypothetical protein VAS14_00176 [Vibrio angustum S14] [Photobacterium angustum S14]